MHQSLDFIPTPVYLANKQAYFAGYPVICNEGGSRSGKTFSTIQLVIHIAAKWKPGIRISIVSHSLPHIKRGAYRDFKLIMEEWGQWDDDNFSFTDYVYTFPNGSYIELFGLDDEKRARGPGRDLLFVNEANLISKTIYSQLAMRTTGQKILDWNPADFNSWVYDLADNPKNKCIHSTYLNNYSNLSSGQIEEIESYKNLPDDFMWKVYGLGQRGAAKEMIYTQWKLIDKLPGKGDVFYGLDFGYVHPAAIVMVEHYEGTNYVQEIIYESGLTLSDLLKKMQGAGISKRAPIYADSAEPKSIEEIFRAGFNIHEADKDVWAGIVKVKSYPLYITADSANLKSEIQGYKWRKDKNDEVLEEPVKSKDDAMDATRYAIFTHLTKARRTILTL